MKSPPVVKDEEQVPRTKVRKAGRVRVCDSWTQTPKRLWRSKKEKKTRADKQRARRAKENESYMQRRYCLDLKREVDAERGER